MFEQMMKSLYVTVCVSGVISLRHWASATERVLNLGLPWRVLRPQLVSNAQCGLVDYQQWMREFSITEPKLEVSLGQRSCFVSMLFFFSSSLFHHTHKMVIHMSFPFQISDNSILETMYRNHSNLETIFRIIDTDHSGQSGASLGSQTWLCGFMDVGLILHAWSPEGEPTDCLCDSSRPNLF